MVGKSLLDKVADVANSAKQLANSAMAGQLNNKDGKLDFNDEAGLAEMDLVPWAALTSGSSEILRRLMSSA